MYIKSDIKILEKNQIIAINPVCILESMGDIFLNAHAAFIVIFLQLEDFYLFFPK